MSANDAGSCIVRHALLCVQNRPLLFSSSSQDSMAHLFSSSPRDLEIISHEGHTSSLGSERGKSLFTATLMPVTSISGWPAADTEKCARAADAPGDRPAHPMASMTA